MRALLWTTQQPIVHHIYKSIHFYDVNTGIAVGSGGTILYTNDGGTNLVCDDFGVTTMLTDVYDICY